MENQQKVDSCLVNWTLEEKSLLLKGLKDYRPCKISQLSDLIIGKNQKEIEAAIQLFNKNRRLKQKKAQKPPLGNKLPSAPLDSWANLLKNLYGLENLQTEIATSFRFIAYFESIPPAACTENIDFRKAYLALADAIEGKTLPNDPAIKCILKKCITETASIGKALSKSTKYKNIIKSINLAEPEMCSFVKPTTDMELATLRHLLNQKNYNPLCLTEDCLIPSAQP